MVLYSVGLALLSFYDNIYKGVNVENINLNSFIYAEGNAIYDGYVKKDLKYNFQK